MDTATAVPTAKLRVVMERSFEDFGEPEKRAFFQGLAGVTGWPVDEMRNVRITRGCVIVEVEMPEEAVRTFLDDYARDKEGTLPPELEALREFLHAHQVSSVNAEYKRTIQIRVSEPSNQAIAFIHGWTGGAATFGDLPERLAARFRCKTHVYEYPTGWLKHSPSIYFVAKNFDNWFRNYVEAQRVAVVVHSMGGLVVRKFLTTQRLHLRPVDQRIKQITFIASPHDGADLAWILKQFPGFNSSQVDELSSRSGFVAELKAQWAEWVQSRVPESCVLRSIYGTNDKLVSPPNAIGYDQEAVPFTGAGHSDILKAPDLGITVGRFLSEAGFTSG